MLRSFVFLAGGVLLVGCYTLQPIGGTTPQVGHQVAFDVNDAGRTALSDRMGPELDQVEGVLVSKDTGGYVIAVHEVTRLHDAGQQVWAGEQVRIASAYIGTTYERRFSAARTAVAAGLGVAAVAGIVGQTLIAGGTGDQGTNAGPGQHGDTAQAARRPQHPKRLPFLVRP